MTVDLEPIDIAVLVSLLVTAIGIGVWNGRRNDDAESFLLGSRSLPWWAILGSIVATETSTATVLSIPGVGFSETGMRWLQIAFGYLIGRTVVVSVFLPLYFQGKLFTAYEVLDKRFGETTKRFASLLFLITRNLGDGLRLFLAGIVIHTLLGWKFETSVIVMGVVTIVYTFLGGLRSVIWNDCIQFVIYMLGGVSALFIIANRVPDGWNQIWTFAEQTGRLQLFVTDFRLSDPYNLWAGLIGGAVLTIGTHGTDHMMVQRYLAARSQKDAGRAIILSSFVVLVQFALFLFIGVQLACFYALEGTVESIKSDQVFAKFIVDEFPRNVGLIGLILAAILAAAMSTLSSSLNSSASALLNDFYLPSCESLPSDRAQLLLSRVFTVLFGVLQIGIGIWAIELKREVVNNALTIAGFSAGLLLGIFSLGVLTKRTGQVAAMGGAISGLAVLTLVQFVWTNSSGAPYVAWPWLALIGTSTTIGTGLILSFFFPRKIEVSK